MRHREKRGFVSFMYVCLCKGIKDSEIRDAVDNGANSFQDVQKQLGVATQCGKCACLASEIIAQTLSSNEPSSNFDALFYSVA
ncbi:bacterioferritin-associated ferredoxin [Teredinibacter purpureus]